MIPVEVWYIPLFSAVLVMRETEKKEKVPGGIEILGQMCAIDRMRQYFMRQRDCNRCVMPTGRGGPPLAGRT